MDRINALIEHLRSTTTDRVVFGFKDIEEIIKRPLPASARKHAAWWANSARTDTHTWAHAWQDAGWRAQVQLASGSVTFTRSAAPPRSALDALLPTKKRTVMALVSEAQIDVSFWKYGKNGEIEEPQSNPNYCYNWSFGSPHEGYVLCVWHKHLVEEKGRIVYASDIGSHTRLLRSELAAVQRTPAQRSRLMQQLERSEAFESAVATSYYASRPLQLILNVGELRSQSELAEKASRVSERELDPLKWYVHSLTPDGNALIVRGEPLIVVDPSAPAGDMSPPETPGEDDLWRAGQIRIRRGQPEFRTKLLEAYEMRCAVTGTKLPWLLEAAHIIPHSVGADYRVSNGMLLRADIHTLYDLYHVSVDKNYVVHLSREVRQVTEYAGYHGKPLRLPAKVSQLPAAANLDSRHQRFLEHERERL